MVKNYLKEIGGDAYKEHLSKKEVIAAQAGTVAPAPAQAPEGQAPQGGGQNPEELLTIFIQAMQAGDQEAAIQSAMAFTSMIAEQYAGEQQAASATPGMRKGGEVKNKITFGKEGKIK